MDSTKPMSVCNEDVDTVESLNGALSQFVRESDSRQQSVSASCLLVAAKNAPVRRYPSARLCPMIVKGPRAGHSVHIKKTHRPLERVP